MRLVVAILALLAILTSGCSMSAPQPTPSDASPGETSGEWQVLADSQDAPSELESSVTWYDISAPDAEHAWLAGMDAGVIATADGGGTWSVQDVRFGGSATDTAHLCAVDADHVWGVDDEGRIVSTANGGTSWATQDHAPMSFADVSFCDARTGWVVGGEVILHTSDGGATWERQPAPLGELKDHDGLASVFALDPEHAWATRVHVRIADNAVQGATVIVYGTSDGGAHWQRLWSGMDASWKVQFVDESHGWMAGAGLWQTTDGGSSWHRLDDLGTWITDACFVDGEHGWVARYGGPRRKGILETADGGATWSFSSLESLGMSRGGLSQVWDISFSDARHGWAVGDDGQGQLIGRYELR